MTKVQHQKWILSAAAAVSAAVGTQRASAVLVDASPLPLPGSAALEQFSFGHESVLGTSMDLIVRAPTSADAIECERRVLNEIERLRHILSTYDASSVIRQHMAGHHVDAPELHELLNAYGVWSERTGGAISANLGGVIGLWKQAQQTGQVPDVAALSTAALDQRALNVDALGKGYIIDRAVEVARRYAPAGLLNIGGDIRAWGDVTWTIGVADPHNPADNAPWLTSFDLRNAAVATSGDYARFIIVGGRRYSHLIDPRTLQPVERITSATVIAKDTLTANALAAAGSVLGADEGASLAQTYGAAGHVFVGADKSTQAGGSIPATQPVQVALATETNRTWPAKFEVSVGIALKNLDTPTTQQAATPATQPAAAQQASAQTPPARAGRGGGRGRYRRPYVAVWVQNADGKTVRTISVWGNQPRWVPELSHWWKAIDGNEAAKTTTRATRPPGQYTVTWDGKDDAGNAVPRGKYTITVEINREHGRHVKEAATIECGDAPVTVPLKATAESDESTIAFGPQQPSN